jgi:hypothetical protein
MGLDITAYSKVRKLQDLPRLEDGDIDWDEIGDEKIIVTANPDFHERAEGIEEGLYACDGEKHCFRAGSYGGYNTFRNMLAQVGMGAADFEVWGQPGTYSGEPFFELVNFSDCEGMIGPKTCAKLYQDFLSLKDTFYAQMDAGGDESYAEYYKQKYEDWTEAFRIGQDAGFVDFH